MTSSVLVAYGSKHGATAEIAEAIAAELRRLGLRADATPAGQEPRDLSAYTGVVLGSAVYMKRWRREARRFLRHHARELEGMPFWIFSSGPVGEAEPDPGWCEPAGVLERARSLGVRDHVVFGGRVPSDPSNFVERAMARDTPPDSADLRDWPAIRTWAGQIASALAPLEAQPSPDPEGAMP